MKGSRLTLGIILGIVLALAARFVADYVCLFSPVRQHRIPIGPHAKDIPKDEEEAYLSLKKHHQITWRSVNGHPIFIEFAKTELKKQLDGKDPFVGMIDSPTDPKNFKRVQCNADVCESDAINPALEKDVSDFKCIRVKYFQQIDDEREDGWIIIKG